MATYQSWQIAKIQDPARYSQPSSDGRKVCDSDYCGLTAKAHGIVLEPWEPDQTTGNLCYLCLTERAELMSLYGPWTTPDPEDIP